MAQESGAQAGVALREARLRAAAVELYPKLLPGRWARAAAVLPVDLVLAVAVAAWYAQG
jgi:hypothetical protein